jgi:hypothetical protein
LAANIHAVAGYFRVSRGRDGMTAPELYRADIEAYCLYRSLNLAHTFVDLDYSGRRGTRKSGVLNPSMRTYGCDDWTPFPSPELFEAVTELLDGRGRRDVRSVVCASRLRKSPAEVRKAWRFIENLL